MTARVPPSVRAAFLFTFSTLAAAALGWAAPAHAAVQCARTITANVVVLDQPLMFNRLGAQNPNGMVFALRRDVVDSSGRPLTRGGVATAGGVRLRPDKRPRPLVLRVAAGDCLHVKLQNLLALDANPNNAGHDALNVDDQVASRHVSFHAQGLQLIRGAEDDGSHVGTNDTSVIGRNASTEYHLYAEKEGAFPVVSHGATFGSEDNQGNGANGLFAVVNVEPRGAVFYRSQLTEEELRLASQDETGTRRTTDFGQPIVDYAATYPNDCGSSEETDGVWCREGKAGLPIVSMLTASNELVHSDLNAVIAHPGRADGVFPDNTYPIEATGRRNPTLPNRTEPFREFTVVFHDEMAAAQAFPAFYGDPIFRHTLFGVRDSFMINYGSGGIGSEIIANRVGVGPMHDCLNCAYEEFFLTSYAVGDPAMLVDVPANFALETLAPGGTPTPGATGPKASMAFYPDDPSNVHHAYIGDHVKFRNVHTGAEQHVFHLHNHQWLFNPNDDNSNYIDAQGIGPGSGYTYEIAYGGAGNRNRSAGDAIFHCHFYPHFAQGMWEHFRVHDVLETGTPLAASGGANTFHTERWKLKEGLPTSSARALPDGEIVAGTPIPAVVPLPGKAMPPMPGAVEVRPSPNTTTAADAHPLTPGAPVPVGSNAYVTDRTKNPGYPFWVGGIEDLVGQRPTTPPLDMLSETDAAALAARTPAADPLFGGRPELVTGAGGFDGGLPRHGLQGFAAGGQAAVTITRHDFTKDILRAKPVFFPEEGTDLEKLAMTFHATRTHDSAALNLFDTTAAPAQFVTNGRPPMPSAPFHEPCMDDKGNPIVAGVAPEFWSSTKSQWATLGPAEHGFANPRVYKGANIQIDAVLNKAGYHYPQQRIISLWEDVAPTIGKQKAAEPFVIRFNTLDCGKYLHTNLVPAYYELDDYQVRTPTDIIGQHIHLPKWDLTTTDGSGNGWNYEDGTLSPYSVRERIHAINAYNESSPVKVATLPRPDGSNGDKTILTPEPHPFFGAGAGDEWLGARITIQRWFFDPVLNAQDVDRGLGTIFTHDHYGPSTHQQIGLYASVLAEPVRSRWSNSETGVALNTRDDGGPTTWQAIISTPDRAKSFREFWFQASDFQHAYEAGVYVGAGPDGRPNPEARPATAETFRNVINPSAREEASPVLPELVVISATCPGGVPRPCPEAISVSDPGMFVVNYRNEPVGLRVFDPDKVGPDGKKGMQADGLAGDLAYALQTRTDRKIAAFNTVTGNTPYAPLTRDVAPGDPFTPILRAYAGDSIRVRTQIGGHEEELQTSINGMKWLQAGSGYGSAPNSGWRNAQANGISEQFTLAIPVTPFVGSTGSSVDYVYSSSQSQDGWWSGIWGLIRTYNTPRTDLAPLPNGLRVPVRVANPQNFRVAAGGVCPAAAPTRSYDITAVLANSALEKPPGVTIVPVGEAGSLTAESAVQHVGGPLDPAGGTLVYNPRTTALSNGKAGPLHDPTAMLLVRTEDLEARIDPATNQPYDGCFKVDPVTLVRSLDPKLPTCPVRLKAGVPTEPITLRAAAGDCIDVLLRNRLPGDLNGNGFLDDVPDLASLGGMQNIVLRDREGAEGVTTFNTNLIRPSSHVGLHTQLLAYDASKADGTNAGRNNIQTAAPGAQTRYRWYAGDITGRSSANGASVTLTATPIEFGGANLSPADPIKQGQKALVGALVIEPRGTAWREDPQRRSAASVGPDGGRRPDGIPDTISHRSFAVVFQKHLSQRYADGSPVESLGGEGTAGVLDDGQEAGQFAINNATEPLWFRFGLRPNALFGNVPGGLGAVANAHLAYSNELAGGDPVTPVFTAQRGQQLRLHLLAPHGSYRGTTFNLHGHVWQRDPYVCPGSTDIGLTGKCTATEVGSRAIGVNPIGFAVGGQESVQPYSHFEVFIPSAGGANAHPGDYLFRDQGAIGNVSGLWGILRVQ